MSEQIEETTEATALTPKDIIKANILAEMAKGNLVKKTIANNVGISRPTLDKYLEEIDKSKLLGKELEGIKDTLYTAFYEILENPESPHYKSALDNMSKFALKFTDKNTPTRNETININIDLDRLQIREQLHNEAIARLPPTMREAYIHNIQEITKEWGLNQKDM